MLVRPLVVRYERPQGAAGDARIRGTAEGGASVPLEDRVQPLCVKRKDRRIDSKMRRFSAWSLAVGEASKIM